jgi:anti-sigma B factor antagonist
MREETLTIEDLTAANGQRILRLSGPLVLSNFFDLQAILREDSSPALVLDFSNVPYIDSAGIGALVCAYVHRQKDSRTLVLGRVTDRVLTALKVTKVDKFFVFSDEVPPAQAALA